MLFPSWHVRSLLEAMDALGQVVWQVFCFFAVTPLSLLHLQLIRPTDGLLFYFLDKFGPFERRWSLALAPHWERLSCTMWIWDHCTSIQEQIEVLVAKGSVNYSPLHHQRKLCLENAFASLPPKNSLF